MECGLWISVAAMIRSMPTPAMQTIYSLLRGYAILRGWNTRFGSKAPYALRVMASKGRHSEPTLKVSLRLHSNCPEYICWTKLLVESGTALG